MKARYWGETKTVMIYCPGCKDKHFLNTDSQRSPCWGFDGNMENPTFTPSLLITTGKYVNPDYKKNVPEEDWEWFEKSSVRCHTFIKAGVIQFLGDCTHDLKNQTVQLPELEDIEKLN
jgi:hypothetical protein